MALRILFVFVLGALVGCGDDSTTVDAGTDSGGADAARADAGFDAGTDAARDAGTDTSEDAGTDSDTDADLDTGVDAEVDAEFDAGVDAGFDAGDAGCMDPPPGPDRPAPVSCSRCRPERDIPIGASGVCEGPDDCTEGENGRCVTSMIGLICDYDECFEDTDCDGDEVCLCDGSLFGAGNVCVSANCRVNADCASGSCAPSFGCLLGAAPEGWYCRTPSDACSRDEDCMEPGRLGGRCAYNRAEARWMCEFGICAL